MKKFFFFLVLFIESLLGYGQITTYPYQQNWESGSDGWIATANIGPLTAPCGSSASTLDLGNPSTKWGFAAHSGSNAWTTNINTSINTGLYSNNYHYALTSPVFDLTSTSQPLLEFWMAYDTEIAWDEIIMEYSVNNGSWLKLGNYTATDWYAYNYCCQGVTSGYNWMGNSSVWKKYKTDISSLKTNTNIRFRLLLKTDWCLQYKGFVVDDFSIYENLSISTGPIISSTFCTGNNLTVNYSTTGILNPGNSFIAQLSDVSGSFASPVNIGSVSSTTSGSINAIIPANVIYGTAYRIRIVSDNPIVTGTDNGTDLTIGDNQKPTFTCPGNRDVDLDGSCQLVVPDLITGLTGNDNCGTVTFTQNPVAGTALSSSHNQTHNVVITADDGNDNTEECTAVLTGKDVTKPTFSCPENDEVDLNGSCKLIVPDLISELTGSDNCGTVTFTQSPVAGTALSSSHNQTHNVVITADDGNGNTEECTVVLTGKDVIKPTVTCPANDDVGLNSSCQLIVPDLISTLTGNDNCASVVTFTQIPAAGDVLSSSHNQAHNIKIIAADGNGNTEECTVVLTGKDVSKPTFTCPANSEVNLNSNCQLIVPNLIAGLTGDDNCGSVTFTQSPAAGEGLSSSHNQMHNIVITAHDGNGNSNECTVVLTAKDITPPTITCPVAVSVPLDFNSTIASNVNLGTPDFNDNCSGSSVGNDAPLTYSLGTTTVTWTVTDAATLTANCTQTVTVDKRQTVIEYIGGLTNQYSDTVRLKAKLTDKLTGNPLSGKLISFTLGTQSESAVTDINGIAYKVMNLLQGPNTYNLKACFDGTSDATYKSACDDDQNYLVKCEDAKLEYTGVTFVNTTCATCSKANILMSASIRDISAVDASDPYPGDISKAFITFTVKDVNNNVKFSQTLPVSLIDPGDKTNGFASTSYQADCGADPGASFTVELTVSGYYCATDQSVVTIAKPLNEFITGGGWIKPVPNLSAGSFKSSDNTKINFGFNVKYNKSGKNLQGNVNIIFRRLECDGVWHVYQLKTTAMGTLTVNTSNLASQTALFTSKAVLKDITYPTSTFSIGGANLKMTVTDKGERGSNDMIGITLTAGSATLSPCGATINNGALLFSSNWSTSNTTEVKLAGGNIVIHGSGSAATSPSTLTRGIQKPTEETPAVAFNVKVSPNPSEKDFRLEVISSTKEDVAITITDVLGRHVKLLNAQPGQVIHFGHELKQGLYIVLVRQGENRQTIKILKL